MSSRLKLADFLFTARIRMMGVGGAPYQVRDAPIPLPGQGYPPPGQDRGTLSPCQDRVPSLPRGQGCTVRAVILQFRCFRDFFIPPTGRAIFLNLHQCSHVDLSFSISPQDYFHLSVWSKQQDQLPRMKLKQKSPF